MLGVEDRGGVPLPTLSTQPCEGPTLTARPAVQDPAFADSIVVICRRDETGTVGFVVNRELPAPARPVFRVPGNVYLGGPLQPAQGVLLHRAPDGVFWTSSRAAAGAISRDAVPSAVVFGHARWTADGLNTEIEGGAWDVHDGAVLPGEPVP
jgi:putative transcriptional regulator